MGASLYAETDNNLANNALEDLTDVHLEALLSRPKQLKLIHLNTQSMVSTFDELLVTIREYSFDIVAMSETWMKNKGPYRPDAIRQRDANFQFSMTLNFTIFLCFSNIRNHLSNFSYLVGINCKIFIR